MDISIFYLLFNLFLCFFPYVAKLDPVKGFEMPHRGWTVYNGFCLFFTFPSFMNLTFSFFFVNLFLFLLFIFIIYFYYLFLLFIFIIYVYYLFLLFIFM